MERNGGGSAGKKAEGRRLCLTAVDHERSLRFLLLRHRQGRRWRRLRSWAQPTAFRDIPDGSALVNLHGDEGMRTTTSILGGQQWCRR
uniref:Uncharacterized protein n=1 Tax=Oryza meridionalis TaxID=40149 RepID=A0A0E0DRN3_9ORYZ